MTHYGPGHSFTMVRGWITFDKDEIFNSSNAEWWGEHYKIADAVRKANHFVNYSDPRDRKEYWLAENEATAILEKRQVLSQDQYMNSLKEYLDLSIDEATSNPNSLIRALAMFDRRFGKRRLVNTTPADLTSPLAKKFYYVRCLAEGLSASDPKSEIRNPK